MCRSSYDSDFLMKVNYTKKKLRFYFTSDLIYYESRAFRFGHVDKYNITQKVNYNIDHKCTSKL